MSREGYLLGYSPEGHELASPSLVPESGPDAAKVSPLFTPEQRVQLRDHLFEVLGIRTKVPDVTKSSNDTDRSRHKRRSGEITGVRGEAVKRNEAWAGLKKDGLHALMDLTQHSAGVPRLSRDGRTISSSWERDGGRGNGTVTFSVGLADEKLSNSLYTQDIVAPSGGKLPPYDYETVARIAKELVGDYSVDVTISEFGRGGMRYHGDPAMTRNVVVRGPHGGKEASLALYQTFRAAVGVAGALEDETDERVRNVTEVNFGKNARNPFEFGEEFLYEYVQRELVEAVTRSLDQRPDLVDSVYDVNAVLDSDSLTPVITILETDQVFGKTHVGTKQIRLGKIPLPRPIDELKIHSLQVKAPQSFRAREGKTVKIDLPLGSPISVSTLFYVARVDSSTSTAKEDMLEELRKRFPGLTLNVEPRQKTSDYSADEVGLEKVKKALAILGVDIEELKRIPPEEQKKHVKVRYRSLMMQYHPDRNPGNEEAEAKAKEVTEAYEILEKVADFGSADEL